MKLTIVSVLALALLAGACGQSHVEYSKTENAVTTIAGPVEWLGDDETNWDVEIDPAKLRVTSSKLASTVGTSNLHSWQTWVTPRRNGPGLSNSELSSNGDYPTTDQVITTGFEKQYTLKATEMKRCVYRNRNIPFHSNTMVLVNQTELICIPITTSIVDESSMRLIVFVSPWATDKESTVTLVGSTAKKTIPRLGEAKLLIKMTARIAPRQAFGGAAKETLPDDMDVLLASHFVGQKPDPACGMERDFLYTVTFMNSKPVRAEVVVMTSQHTVQEFEDFVSEAPMLTQTPDNARAPSVNISANNACYLQHMAWMECAYVPSNTTLGATRTERCSPEVGKAMDKNFKALLRSSATIDGRTHKLYFISEAEANAINPYGAKSGLWHDKTSDPTDKNLLSIEDFQQFVDVINMSVVKK